eukprot:403359946
MTTYFDILIIRSFFFFFELNAKLMKCSAIIIMFILLPFHTLWTFLGTSWYSNMMQTESTCFPDTAWPWLIIFALSLSYFLIFIFCIILCSFGVEAIKNTRFKIVFQSFNEEQNNDQIINNFLNENLLNNLDQDRQDPSMRPLTDRDLRKLKLEKASEKHSQNYSFQDKRDSISSNTSAENSSINKEQNSKGKQTLKNFGQSLKAKLSFKQKSKDHVNNAANQSSSAVPAAVESDVCSICCDDIHPKVKIRKMPVCNHAFHQNCIDNWLKMKPTCPNCNRKVRDIIDFD